MEELRHHSCSALRLPLPRLQMMFGVGLHFGLVVE